MKQLIRQKVFETNSSSTHSISIATGTELLDNLFPDDEGNILLEGGEFGWEYEVYSDAYNKANYVATQIAMLESSKKDFETRKDKEVFKYYTLPKFAYENYEICKQNFVETIKEQTGCNEVIILAQQGDYNGRNYVYIDHQSFEDASDAEYLLNKEDIRQLIFNKSSTITTDNDNH